MARVGAGEVIMVLSGEAHALRTDAGAMTVAHGALRRDEGADLPLARSFGKGRTAARVLSARLRAAWPDGVERAGLPALLYGGDDLLRADALARVGLGAGATALLTRLAEMLLVAGLRADPACRRILSGEKRDAVEAAIQRIAASPAHPWTVESLARAVGMGRSNFAAQFSLAVGKAPMEVVAEHRMEHAAALLRQGRMKIAEIAELAGYGSEAAFSRRFSRYFGTTPSRMREAARQAKLEAAPTPRSAPCWRARGRKLRAPPCPLLLPLPGESRQGTCLRGGSGPADCSVSKREELRMWVCRVAGADSAAATSPRPSAGRVSG
ncbi:helix-turn-helix transcriptional regulator [Novosphingobium resinovorum]